jgi:sulfite reductase beta subunit-like hemoprotein
MDNLAVELKEHIKELMDHKKEEKMSEEVKEELSAAVEPIAHNPEEVSKKKINLLSQNKTLTTQDIVFNKLFNK